MQLTPDHEIVMIADIAQTQQQAGSQHATRHCGTRCPQAAATS
jgi:hypothetical protein